MDYLRKSIERKTSTDMKTLMQRYVLNPGKMRDTHFGWEDELEHRFVQGTVCLAGCAIERKSFDELKVRGPSGAGSMFATIVDYALFL